MGSFKVKLVAYFLLLSLLPLAAAFWGFSTVASQSEARRVDARLQAGLRATLAAYQEALGSANAAAERLARQPSFQRALLAHDRPALERMLAGKPNLAVEAPGGFHVGKRDPTAPTRQVAVVGAGGTRGTVVASVPLDRALVSRLEARSGLERADHVLLVKGGGILAGPPGVAGRLDLLSGKPGTVSLGGTRYRALVAGTLGGSPTATLGVISPQRLIDAANRNATNQLLIGLIAALVFVGCVAYVEGRTIVRTIRRLVDAAAAIARGDLKERVPVQGRDEFALLGRTFNQMAFQLEMRLEELEAERARLRDVTSRFSEALGATHDSQLLMRLVVEAAMEATNAVGGVIVATSGSLVKAGFPDKGAERLEVPLQAGSISFGSLLLFGAAFTDEDRMTAVSLASHAVVALDNARLHGIVERQALIDGLTGLANRRQCEETLADELARVERFGGDLAVVVADLDWFKDVNDRYGHPAGDSVLREFGLLLQETVRDVDLAGRWGGEEFVLVLPGTDLEGGAQLAERIRALLAGRTLLAVDGGPIPVTASFGVAAVPPTKTPSDLFAAADAAMYQAKRAGKNRVQTAREPVSHS